jgi:hypothetical protein
MVPVEVGMTVTLPYDPDWKALAWAKEYCSSYITNKASNTTRLKPVSGGWVNDSSIVYYFSDEQDAVMFALRWL